MVAPENILDLVDRFQRNLDAYRSGQYNEAQVRREFIDPMFEALDWDVSNKKGYAEAYKEVVHEDSLRIGGAVKAPDYAYRIGGARKFFLEAKKPSVNIKEAIHPAYQLRRYAWSAKLPLSILTDFEEFAVYDCRIKPNKTDKASQARIMYIRFDEYPERWGEIADIFARESILKGSFDKYAESHRKKRGTAEVDSAFLAEIEAWRDALAKNIALRNPALTQRELNHAVQQTIDRIIFLRIAEDRGIEDYGRLMALQNGKDIYKRLLELFRKADGRYNSGLFHFHAEKGRPGHPDTLTPGLAIDDKALTPILKSLYYPDSPYEFSVLPADILGQVYEQFLGKVIRLTAGHQAKVEDKPEVKKAGGVYYTPTYIVDYIVEHTVGKLLEGKKPAQVARLTVCDPACGSGSFLLGAYQYLLEWHLKWYSENEIARWGKGRDPKLYQIRHGEWRLTTNEKKRILLNNIHGVDIDNQAVEVTKLSLLLKVLENETQDTLGRQMAMFHERALPDLSSNIKCGNSLIGPDFYDQQNLGLLDEDARYRINVFDWQAEFPAIFSGKNPGFDAIIGNPPWGAIFTDPELAYLRRKYRRVISRMVDSYIYFIDQATRLAKVGEKVGFIIPSTILNQADAKAVREALLTRGITTLVSLGRNIFGTKVLNTSTILISAKLDSNESIILGNLDNLPIAERRTALDFVKGCKWHKWQELVQCDPHATFFAGSTKAASLLSRLRRENEPLEEMLQGRIQRGISPDIASAHVVSIPQANLENLEQELLRPSVSGKQIKRYNEWYHDQWIIYTTRSTPIEKFPNIGKFLSRFKMQNSCKEVVQGKHPWWALHRPRDPRIFASPKFIGLTTSKTCNAPHLTSFG